MDDKKEKYDRIKELKLKIDYAKTARENYKDTNLALSETNSYYLDKLTQELRELEKSYIGIVDKNQRKFSRIKIQRAIHINFSSKQYYGFINDISLSGSFIEGSFKQSKGDICRVDLKESSLHSETAIRAIASVVRACDCGMAIEFIAMKRNSYLKLKAELLTIAADPLVLKDEIFHQEIFEFYGDLVCNSMFKCSKKKVKKLLELP